MNKIWFLGIAFFLYCCSNSSNETSNIQPIPKYKGDPPYMYFKEDFHDFGKINEGETVSYSFVLENRGKSDLIISYIDASCGCTIAKWDQKPLPPRKTTIIEVIFNSEGKTGIQNKSVKIKSNANPDIKFLNIRCEVLSPNNN